MHFKVYEYQALFTYAYACMYNIDFNKKTENRAKSN